MPASREHIYLIPGFFGFANFGDLKYFAHVSVQLERVFAAFGGDAEIHYVPTLPTASLRRRVLRLSETIQATASRDDVIHLVGHSSGGLDARLLVSPGVELGEATEAIARRVSSVCSIATPHHGVPQVSSFVGAIGPSLLRALSITTVHSLRLGSVPLPVLTALAGVLLPRSERFQGPVSSILDQIYHRLLKDFDEGRQEELEEFLRAANEDQGLLPQLAHAEMADFNRSVGMRSTVRYGSVVIRAQPPSWRVAASLGLSTTVQATYAMYRALYTLASQMPSSFVPVLTDAQDMALKRVFGETPLAEANDAIVPTCSQVFGDIIHAAWADHLDVIGHFGDPGTDPPHVEWLITHSGFKQEDFCQLWQDVGTFLLKNRSGAQSQ